VSGTALKADGAARLGHRVHLLSANLMEDEPGGCSGLLGKQYGRQRLRVGTVVFLQENQPERLPASVRNGMVPKGMAIDTSVFRQFGKLSAQGRTWAC